MGYCVPTVCLLLTYQEFNDLCDRLSCSGPVNKRAEFAYSSFITQVRAADSNLVANPDTPRCARPGAHRGGRFVAANDEYMPLAVL